MAKNAMAEVLRGLALLLICVMAFSIRLFSVVKYESVIHEFDPYFNYRVTQFLTKEGFYNLWNWFDVRTWYPLGRVIGGTMYPVRRNVLDFGVVGTKLSDCWMILGREVFWNEVKGGKHPVSFVQVLPC